MFEFLSQAFVTLLVVIDPIAVVPMFVMLTRNDTLQNKSRIARKASMIATIILLSFAVAGDKLLDAMNISEPAFRIAGGFLLLLAAMEMVVARHTGLRSTTGDEKEEAIHREDISVFPLAIPLIAGPGAFTSVVVLIRQADELHPWAWIYIVAILMIVMLILYLSLLAGDRLMKLLGVTGANVLTRVFGIILAALAVQSIINGIAIVVKKIIETAT